MAGRSHPRCEKLQSRDGGTGDRRSRAGPFNANHNSLRRRWPLRPRRRKPAADGLQKRKINGRRLQGLESGRIACDKITRASWRVELTAEYTSESKLPAHGPVMTEAAFPHELGDGPSDN